MGMYNDAIRKQKKYTTQYAFRNNQKHTQFGQIEGTVKLRTRYGQIEKLALVIAMGGGEWCGGAGYAGEKGKWGRKGGGISEVCGERGERNGGGNCTKSRRLLFLGHVLYRAPGRTFV